MERHPLKYWEKKFGMFSAMMKGKCSSERPVLGERPAIFNPASAVVEDRFLCRHVGSNFIPTAKFVDRQNNGQEINAVMFQPKSKLRFTRWIIGTGRVNSGWLSIKHAAALTCSAFRKQSSLFGGLFYRYFVF